MQAIDVLRRTADAYRALGTLSVSYLVRQTVEGDVARSISEFNYWAFYEAPDKVRVESGLRRRNMTLVDGCDYYDYSVAPEKFKKRKRQLGEGLPGSFYPDSPSSFLYFAIADNIQDAEVLPSAPGTIRVSVGYTRPRDPWPASYPLRRDIGPTVFEIDEASFLVRRTQRGHTRRFGETAPTRHLDVCEFTETVVDQPIPASTFVFTGKSVVPLPGD